MAQQPGFTLGYLPPMYGPGSPGYNSIQQNNTNNPSQDLKNGIINSTLGVVPATIYNGAQGLSNSVNPLLSFTDFLKAFQNPNAPSLLSPNELFDPVYWQALGNSLSYANNPTQINTLNGVAQSTLLTQKYGPGGPSNYKTLLIKGGTEVLFVLIFLILIYAFVTDRGE